MSCQEARELFSDHLDGALAPQDEDRLGAHLAGCPACREALLRYEAPFQSLAGAAPPPPEDLADRILDRAEEEGLLIGTRRFWLRWGASLAAGLALLLLGYSLGGGGAGTELPPAPSWTTLLPAETCATQLMDSARLDPAGIRRTSREDREDARLIAGAWQVILPGTLGSSGPYDPGVEEAIRREGAVCLPFTAPFGDLLVLTVAPAAGGMEARAGTFQVEPDPRRVMYARILWLQDGLVWALEGRAPQAELLELARELATGVRVEEV